MCKRIERLRKGAERHDGTDNYRGGEEVRKEMGERTRGGTKEAQRLLKSSFLLLQSICGALLLERFWWASSLACCSDMFRDSPAPSLEAFSFGFFCKCIIMKNQHSRPYGLHILKSVCVCVWTQTSGAEVLAGAAEVEVLEEVLEVDRLIATLGFSSWVAFPFTC